MKQLKIARQNDQPPDTYTEVTEPSQLHCQEFEATLILSIAAQAGFRTYVQTDKGGEPLQLPDLQEFKEKEYPPMWIIGEDKLGREPTYLDLSRVRVRNGNLRVREMVFPLADPTFNMIEKLQALTPDDVFRASDEHWNHMLERNPHMRKFFEATPNVKTSIDKVLGTITLKVGKPEE